MISVIDLGGTRTKFGLVDKGELIEASHCEARSKGSIETHLDEVADLIADLLVQRGLRFSDCAGIGVSSTGIVDSAGACVLTTNGKYENAVGFDFAAWARRRAGLSLRIENDARAAAVDRRGARVGIGRAKPHHAAGRRGRGDVEATGARDRASHIDQAAAAGEPLRSPQLFRDAAPTHHQP